MSAKWKFYLAEALVVLLSWAVAVGGLRVPNTPRHRSDRYGAEQKAQEIAELKYKRDHGFGRSDRSSELVEPKVMIVTMFGLEAQSFLANYQPSLYGLNITVPGFSPRYPQVSCTDDGEVCHMTTGEAEINAAASISALVYSRLFNLTQTYFLVCGVSGINPHMGTTGSVTFPRFAVQLALQYEIDSRQLPAGGVGFTSGYFTQGTKTFRNNLYPSIIYGTEVFELSRPLRKRAFLAARKARLFDTDAAAKYRLSYPFSPARDPPSVLMCDTGTADVYWTGSILAEAFGNLTTLLTNGTGRYCTTQQEDNAVLGVLVRAAAAKIVDFSRVIILRTASDFDRAPPGVGELYHLLQAPQGGFPGAIANIYLAGVEVIIDILENWDTDFREGIKPDNYIGDILNTLKNPYGFSPDIGVDIHYVHPAL
ncbi:hypothetical protein ABW19_dt0208977 [Dactylella cylindrospora]|nr:hypothetical protein ABW19_dt0208977 [Dactylella cylindrospora]